MGRIRIADEFMKLARCLALLLAIVVGPAPAWPRDVKFRFNEVVVSIDVPSEIEVLSRPVGPIDFLIYDITSQGVGLGGVYVGNAPQKPDVPQERLRKGVIAGCVTYSYERPEGGGNSRDVYVLLAPPAGAPQVVHFFYRSLTEAQARQVDAIVASLKPTRGAGCKG